MIQFAGTGTVATPGPGVAGAVLWLDAGTGVYEDAGSDAAEADDLVYQWNDQSGNGNHAVQTSSSSRPILKNSILNSLPVIRFDRTVPYQFFNFSLPSLSAGTLFVVIRAADSSDNGVWEISTATDNKSYYPFSAQIYEAFGTNTRRDAITPGVALTSWRIYSVVASSSEWTARIDGSTILTTGTNTVSIGTSNKLGAITGAGFSGDIAEVLIYDSALSGTDRGTVETYLETKYGL